MQQRAGRRHQRREARLRRLGDEGHILVIDPARIRRREIGRPADVR